MDVINCLVIINSLEVYKLVEPATLAAVAIAYVQCGSHLVGAPNFRPGLERTTGKEPATRSFDELQSFDE